MVTFIEFWMAKAIAPFVILAGLLALGAVVWSVAYAVIIVVDWGKSIVRRIRGAKP